MDNRDKNAWSFLFLMSLVGAATNGTANAIDSVKNAEIVADNAIAALKRRDIALPDIPS